MGTVSRRDRPRLRTSSARDTSPCRVPWASGRTSSTAHRWCHRGGDLGRARWARRAAPSPRSGGSCRRRGEHVQHPHLGTVWPLGRAGQDPAASTGLAEADVPGWGWHDRQERPVRQHLQRPEHQVLLDPPGQIGAGPGGQPPQLPAGEVTVSSSIPGPSAGSSRRASFCSLALATPSKAAPIRAWVPHSIRARSRSCGPPP